MGHLTIGKSDVYTSGCSVGHLTIGNNDNSNKDNGRIQGPVQFERFYSLLTVLPTASSMYSQVAQVQLCANQMQHIERLSRVLSAACHKWTAQLLCLTEFKWHLF